MSCRHDCQTPPRFPARIHNRPALDRIAYRIGDYARFRETLIAGLDRAGPLAAWTHRGSDDPGIALLEASAEVAEVLAFYQELYANEAFLRTARWPESIRDLVALSGYRLAPGVGGETVFAVAVTGEQPVVVPAGFGFNASLESGAAVFESISAVTAHPALSEFHLYPRRQAGSPITAGGTRLELAAVNSSGGTTEALEQRLSQAPEAGDRLLLMPDDSSDPPEIVIVREVETVLDRIVIHLEGELIRAHGMSVNAYPIDRSFRHFGHNAPNHVGGVDDEGAWAPSPTDFTRFLRNNSPGSDTDDGVTLYSAIDRRDMPLDTQVDDLPPGTEVICEGYRGSQRFTRLRRVQSSEPETLTWAAVSGSSTVLRLDSRLFDTGSASADIRRLRFHEVTGPALQLQSPTRWPEGESGTRFNFFGSRDQARVLAGRELLFEHEDGRVVRRKVDSPPEDFDIAGRENGLWMWTLELESAPGFAWDDFDEIQPRVTVYGNLVDADQGETQDALVLGSGDRRRRHQTFRLPKAPLTHFHDPGRTPAQRPALEIHVDGVRWAPVDSFFGWSSKDRVYVLRHGSGGETHVQFGDGKQGARLPTGRGNVTARYRIGVAANGPLEEGAKPSATGKLKPLDKVFMPGMAVNGGKAESEDSARVNTPHRLQSLDRLVGLADYEAEAAGLPGVLKAGARHAAPDGMPQLRLVVLTEGGEDAEVSAVAESLREADRKRGSSRRPVVVVGGRRRYVHLSLLVGYDPDRRRADIEAAVRANLGEMNAEGEDNGTGLLALSKRRFGQDVHRSQVIAAVQQVEGVRWVQLKAMQAIPPGDPAETDPEALTIPDSTTMQASVACPGDRLLALYADHLVITLVAGEPDEGSAENGEDAT